MKKLMCSPEEKVDLWDRRVQVVSEAVSALGGEVSDPSETKRKILLVLERIASGDRWGKALEMVGWRWADFSRFSFRNAQMKDLLRLMEEHRSAAQLRKLEDEAERRAVEGVEEDVFTAHGKKAGTKRVYSDTLLVRLLKAQAPEKYADNPGGVPGGGLTLNVNLGDLRKPAAPGKVIDVKE